MLSLKKKLDKAIEVFIMILLAFMVIVAICRFLLGMYSTHQVLYPKNYWDIVLYG